MRLRAVAALTAGILLGPGRADAQELRGTVTDSITRQPVAGVVVALLDAGARTLSRGISNERGEYRLVAPPQTMRRVRAVRIGYRPREVEVPPGATTLDLAMRSIPTMLEAVQVTAGAHCPRRPDRPAALALREQVRAGLLATVVSRELRTAQMVRLDFERSLDSRGRIEKQTVRIDSGETAGSWQAAMRARDFVRVGFLVDQGDSRTFYGPDADVLLDDAFADGYCYHLRTSATRPRQIGLAFLPASRARDRVDVDGTLWVDTAARKLKDIEYRYLGLRRDEEALQPGGHVSFWEMPNGVVFIDRWFIRMPTPAFDTTYGRDNLPVVRSWLFAREAGGEVASAAWPGGHTYHAALGALHAVAVNEFNEPVRGGVIRLEGTDYITSPDANGVFEFSNLLPGPYVATIVPPEIEALGIRLPTPLRFTAHRDSVVQERMLVPPPTRYVHGNCDGTARTAEPDPWLIVRIVGLDGKHLAGIHWELRKDNGVTWQWLSETRTSGADGLIYPCLIFARGDHVEIRGWRAGRPHVVEHREITRKRTTVTLTIPPD